MSIRNNFSSFALNYNQIYSKGGFLWLFMMAAKNPPLVSKVNHLVDDYLNYEDTPDTMIVENRHDPPYIGDFPPKDDYSEHHFY